MMVKAVKELQLRYLGDITHEKNKRFVVTVQKAMVEAYYPLKDKSTWDI